MNTQIINEWIHEGINLNGPANEAEILSCESVVDFKFPDDFKKFYSVCNGFAEWEMDSRMLSLWPLIRIQSDNFKKNFIAFADYNVNGSQIGFLRGQMGIYKDYNLSRFCETFDEFIDHWQKNTGLYF